MQVIFTFNEQISASRLNQATQGYKLLRRFTYAGSTGSPVGNVITATANWSPGSGTSALFVRVCGAGGGGAGCFATTAGTIGAGSGGAGGGYAEKWILSGFGSQQLISIGLGGTGGPGSGTGNGFTGGASSFGNLIQATGGTGGFGTISNQAGTTFQLFGGGNGGIGLLGDLNVQGDSGGIAMAFPTDLPLAGRGGRSGFGGSGGAERTNVNSGLPGAPYGGGGGGAAVQTASNTRGGGNGAPGFVIVDEYA